MPRRAAAEPAAGEMRDGFAFFAGHPALDLAATVRGRLRGAPQDLLAQPLDLERWLAAAGLGSAPLAAGGADLALARELRESVYALALARIGAEPAPTRARQTLNRIAAGRGAVPQLGARGQLVWQGSAHALLVALAQDGVRLFAGSAAERIRQCEGATCARLFVDTSRSGERRWCSMASCGNKAKVAEFRRRQRAAGEAPS